MVYFLNVYQTNSAERSKNYKESQNVKDMVSKFMEKKK